MADDYLNDNETPREGGKPNGPDAHGQAAMLLIESLIHALVERAVLTPAEAVEFVEVAADVEEKSPTNWATPVVTCIDLSPFWRNFHRV